MESIQLQKTNSLLMAEQILARLEWKLAEGMEVTETFVVDGYIRVKPWDNCREQGYQIICEKFYDHASVRTGRYNQAIIFAFGEHRNVDQPVLWVNKGDIYKTQDWARGSEDFRSINGEKSKYDTCIETIDECAQTIYDAMVEFYSEIEVLDNNQCEDIRHGREPKECKRCENVMMPESFPDDDLWDDGYCSPECWEKANTEAYIPKALLDIERGI